MFECQACFRHHLRTIFSIAPTEGLSQHPRATRVIQRAFRTAHAGAQVTEAQGKQQDSNKDDSRVFAQYRTRERGPRTSWKDSPERKSQSTAARAALKNGTPEWVRPTPSYRTHASGSDVGSTGRVSTRLSEGNLTTELKYLKDPLKLADHVRYTLDKDDIDKAVALVRLSSKGAQNTVSWNHVIDWNMKHSRTKAALETYNEMKKRGQKPDSHTYLLLLRGLADHTHHPHTLGNALSIYHSMTAPNSKVARNIIHTNAMLKVCARANDMDSLWDIASKLPDSGSYAANSWTFTTILNSLRTNTVTKIPAGETSSATARRHEEVILQARRLWGPVISRWRQGDLMLDEELVCAMGRLLLIGARPRDWDDVLSLIQQSMDISRLVPRLGTAARGEAAVPRIRAPATPQDMKNDDSEIPDEYGEPLPGSEFDAFDAGTKRAVGQSGVHIPGGKRRGDGPSGYARPGNSTVSLVLEACLKMAAREPALAYWDLLTSSESYGIRPDADNAHMLLRVLRQARDPGEAATLVCDDMPRLGLRAVHKTFRIAMSACARDAANPDVLRHAGRILDAMLNTLEAADATTLVNYLTLAKESQEPAEIARAVERAEPGVVNLRSLVTFGRVGASPGGTKEQMMLVFKALISCYDRILRMNDEAKAGDRRKLSDKARGLYLERKSKLSAFLLRTFEKQRDLEAKMKGNVGEVAVTDEEAAGKGEGTRAQHGRQRTYKERPKTGHGGSEQRRVAARGGAPQRLRNGRRVDGEVD